MKNLFLFTTLLFLLFGCSRRIVIPDQGNHKMRKVIEQSGLANDHYMGFALYDPENGKMVYELNSDKYFVPASNTKIFTLYTALIYLPDSLACLEIAETDSQLILRGTAHPAFLHPEYELYQHPLVDLLDTTKEIRISNTHFKDKRFGNGWAWNDYPYGYQAEKSALPIFGNLVWIEKMGDGFQVKPEWYQSFFTIHSNDQLPLFYRDEFTNAFSYHESRLPDTGSWHLPFSYSEYEVSQILSREIGKEVNPLYQLMDLNFRPIYSIPLDTVYRQLMRHSDNFIAEQLLLAAAKHELGYMASDSMIRYARSTLFQAAPDRLLWYDGSGLSRYNMFTPRTVVWVLSKLLQTQGETRVRDIFPAGGISGTISYWYGAEKPYVYAKTGTLRNKHCLSGYLFAESGKMYIFSFMHNNYPGGSRKVKQKMQSILEYIRDSF